MNGDEKTPERKPGFVAEEENKKGKNKKYDRLRFSVQDTGMGIKPEDKAKLF